jgi:urea carboxylase
VQSGFICLQTVLTSELWKMGQLSPGNKVRFIQCSWEQAQELDKKVDRYLAIIDESVRSGSPTRDTIELAIANPAPSDSVLYKRGASSGDNDLPRFIIRQAGDRGVLCDFGSQVFDLSARVRAQQLLRLVPEQVHLGLEKVTRPHTMSVFIAFDPAKIHQLAATELLVQLESTLSRASPYPGKTYHLPMLFDPEENLRATARYMETQRPYATYLPDNIDFIRRNNGLATKEDVRKMVDGVPFVVLANSGMMGLPILIQVDPRKRFTVPKANPSRSFTPAGALGTGGNTTAIYGVDQ